MDWLQILGAVFWWYKCRDSGRTLVFRTKQVAKISINKIDIQATIEIVTGGIKSMVYFYYSDKDNQLFLGQVNFLIQGNLGF